MIYLIIYLIIGLILAGVPTYKDLKGGCKYESWLDWAFVIGAGFFWPVALIWLWVITMFED